MSGWYWLPFLGVLTIPDEIAVEIGAEVGDWEWRGLVFEWLDFGVILYGWARERV